MTFNIPLATRNDEGKRVGGTILTGGPKGAHGGILKLTSINGKGRAKVSAANPAKATLIGDKRSYEITNEAGELIDVVYGKAQDERLNLPPGLTAHVRQIPFVLNGQRQYFPENPFIVQAYGQAQVERFGHITPKLSEQLQSDQEAFVKRVEALKTKDAAMRHGGIDLDANKMRLTQTGDQAQMSFDEATMARFKQGDFTGINPVIVRVQPLTDISLLLGLGQVK